MATKKIVLTDDEDALACEAELLKLEAERDGIAKAIKYVQDELAARLKQLERISGQKVGTKHYSVTRSLVTSTTRLDAARVKRLLSAAQYRSCSVSKTVHRAPVTPRLSKLQRIKDAS